MYKVVIQRAPSGSGKSFTAQELADQAVQNGHTAVILSTDSVWLANCPTAADNKYWYNGREVPFVDGELISFFNPEALGAAHEVNRAKFKTALARKINLIIVDNTCCDFDREGRPYAELAFAAGYEVEVVHPKAPWFGDIYRHAEKNVHNVPRTVLEKQFARYNQTSPEQINQKLKEIKENVTRKK